MKVTLTPSKEFLHQLKLLSKKYKSLGADYEALKESLLKHPFQGDDLGGGVRKVRMAIRSKGKGKRGGARVLTLTILVSNDADVTLLTIYDKGEIDNVSDDYIDWLVQQHNAKK